MFMHLFTDLFFTDKPKIREAISESENNWLIRWQRLLRQVKLYQASEMEINIFQEKDKYFIQDNYLLVGLSCLIVLLLFS